MIEIYGTENNDNLSFPYGNTSGTIYGRGGNDIINGGSGNDSLYGDNGNDFIIGSLGNDTLDGGNGNDTLIGSEGNDTFYGGFGSDIYVVDSTDDTVIEVGSDTDTVQSLVSYTLDSGIENLVLLVDSAINGTGNSSNNSITGNSASNSLNGGSGNDTLNGQLGNDILNGNSGNDILVGDAGNDQFRFASSTAFTSAEFGVDTINDFSIGLDKIVLDKTAFTALSSAAGNGFSVASEFAVVGSDTAAATSNADIVYNSANGNLFYNPNGALAGFGTGAQFATLTGSPVISASSFIIEL